MTKRPLTCLAAAALCAAACGAPSAQETAARVRADPMTHATAPSRVEALLADADVAAAAGDALSARKFVREAVVLEPGNAAARARLAQLGGPAVRDAPELVSTENRTLAPPAVVSGAPIVRVAVAPRAHTTARGRGHRSGETTAAVVVPRDRLPVTTDRGELAVGGAVAHDSSGVDVIPVVTTVRNVKHKRTWPWTRAQRWLVAKGLGGGAGAGVVLGAIIGNVPGAVLAGSLTGGAVGFKHATKIGPAEPYPSEQRAAAFDAGKHNARADSVTVAGSRQMPGHQASVTLAVAP